MTKFDYPLEYTHGNRDRGDLAKITMTKDAIFSVKMDNIVLAEDLRAIADFLDELEKQNQVRLSKMP